MVKFDHYNCTVVPARYPNGRLGLQLFDTMDRALVTTATINIPQERIEADEVIIKNYAENDGIETVLLTAGIITRKVREIRSGFITAPVYKVNPEFLA